MAFDDEYGFDPVPPPPAEAGYDPEKHFSELYAGLDRWRDGTHCSPADADREAVRDILDGATYTADDIYRFCGEAELEREDGHYVSHAINTLDADRVHLPDMAGVSYVGARNRGTDIVVHGDTGLFCGHEMRGGTLHVEGDAGAGLAAGMRGGLVEVEGDVLQTGAVGHEMVGGAVILGGAYELDAPYREAEVYEREENGDLQQVWPPR